MLSEVTNVRNVAFWLDVYLFLAIATVIKPKTPMPIAGPIVLSAKKVHTAKAMQSRPTIGRSFLISIPAPLLQFVV